MGEKRKIPSAEPKEAGPFGAAELRAQIIGQTPAVYITLLSVLVGLVLADLVAEARGRMHLWPLDYIAVRTWAQLIANGGCALGVWAVLAHLGMTRRRVPDLAETLSAFAPPLLLLVATSFVGHAHIWPWLYGAGLYLATCVMALTMSVRLTMDQPGGRRFARLLRLRGCLGVICFGVAAYIVAGWLDQHGDLSPGAEMALALAPTPANVLVAWLFFRDWRAALED